MLDYQKILNNAKDFVIWIIFGIVTGVVSGLIGTAFHLAVDYVTEIRMEHFHIIFFMPLAAIIIHYIYHLLKVDGQGTDTIIKAALNKKEVSLLLAPAIFASTVLTHFTGGSAGREGAALQIGGSISSSLGRLFHLESKDQRSVILAGMAGVFAALFGTPIGATIFATTVLVVSVNEEKSFMAALVSALVADYVAKMLGVPPTRFAVETIALTPKTFLVTIVLGLIFSLAANLFYRTNHFAEHKLAHYFKNPLIRSIVATSIVVIMTLVFSDMRYNGAGMNIIAKAIEQGEANYYDFLLKIIFTALTLAAGLKGGEVVPSFFIGATLGCVIGPIFGLPASLSAAMGMIGVFCGCTNTLLASLVLAIEMFGVGGLPFYALCLTVVELTSTDDGFYHAQRQYCSNK